MKTVTREILLKAKQSGFSDRQLATIWKTDEMSVRALRRKLGVLPVYKTVDTCAAEFAAETPYHYSTYETENESRRTDRKKVVILGGGPNRIGQGIEFDYCCVHGVMGLAEEGYETIMINCNPETVSTDYDTTDKLYFEPLTLEDVLNICEQEKPDGVIVSFGGQTPLKLAKALESHGYKILGTSVEGIDLAEDRERFGKLVKELGIPCPPYGTASGLAGARAVAKRVGYPLLVRPSYVLGGRAMEICYDEEALVEYMERAVHVSPEHPVLLDRFLEDAFEFDVDAISDGEEVYIGGVMQHIEEAGIHSGDSSCVLPPYAITGEELHIIMTYTHRLARGLGVVGLMNVQYAMRDGIVYVIEVNPRASRTIPFVSKATGIPLARIAARLMVGKKLKEFGIAGYGWPAHVAVKESVFPFPKFPESRHFLGPEMHSTGEVMGISDSFSRSFAKASLGAGMELPPAGTVFVSLNDNDKRMRAVTIVRSLVSSGFRIIATAGTAAFLARFNIAARPVLKASEGTPNVIDEIATGGIQLIINTPLGQVSRMDEHAIGRAAMQRKVPFITTLSAAAAAAKSIGQLQNQPLSVLSIQEYHGHMASVMRPAASIEDCFRLVAETRSMME